MKILFHSVVNFNRLDIYNTMADYVGDTVFHGMRSLIGSDLTDYPRMWHMYSKDRKEKPENFNSLYGKGFTLYGLLPDDTEIDRTDIENKVKTRYYDYIVLAMHCTRESDSGRRDLEKIVDKFAEYYPYNRIVFVDGSDLQTPTLPNHVEKILYFKRERVDNKSLPLSIGFPKEKITHDFPEKTKPFGSMIPYKTYKFNNEEDYYNDYRSSYFGVTCKKGGWDSMRNYEILACRCLPCFVDIDSCPELTMSNHMKKVYSNIIKLPCLSNLEGPNYTLDIHNLNISEYFEFNELLYNHFCNNLTTESIAKNIYEHMGKSL